MMHRCVILGVLALVLGGCGEQKSNDAPPAKVENPASGEARPSDAKWDALAEWSLRRGVGYLLATGGTEGAPKWAFDPAQGPDAGITAIAAYAILSAPGNHLEKVRGTLDWLVSLQKEDGSIHQGAVASYVTAASVLAFKKSGDARYAQALARGTAYLESVQLDEAEGLSQESQLYGGFGYKEGNPNPNLSTTQWALEGARAGGNENKDFYKKALLFLTRLQNHSETNDQVFTVDGKKVVPGDDGGAFYQPAVSKAGVEKLADGRLVLRSYGSMSYALLKCYLLADLDPRNERVRAVLAWLGDHWDLSKNPGMEHAEGEKSELMGLYYYYLTIGRTLSVCESRSVPLEGKLAGWRKELAKEIVGRQAEDGSWVNPQDRWWEGNHALVTAYALLGLAATLP